MSDKNQRKKSQIMKILDLIILYCLNITMEFAWLIPKSQESKTRFCLQKVKCTDGVCASLQISVTYKDHQFTGTKQLMWSND